MAEGEYDRRREGEGERQRGLSAKGRDIGPTPNIADVRRRARCAKSLKLFCTTYNPEAFALPWSANQERGVRRIEEAVETAISARCSIRAKKFSVFRFVPGQEGQSRDAARPPRPPCLR